MRRRVAWCHTWIPDAAYVAPGNTRSAEAGMEFLSGQDSPAAIEALIREAAAGLVLVTPYFDPTRDQLRWLAEARVREVQVALFIREGADQAAGVLERCGEMGVRIRTVERLHAKLYASEKTLILSSMNLQAAALDSWDVAVRVERASEPAIFEQGVRLIRALEEHLRLERSREPRDPSIHLLFITGQHQEIRRLALDGNEYARALHAFCLGCQATTSSEAPFCARCVAIEVASGQHRQGRYCARCGGEFATTVEKPYCWSCFERVVLRKKERPPVSCRLGLRRRRLAGPMPVSPGPQRTKPIWRRAGRGPSPLVRSPWPSGGRRWPSRLAW